MSIKSPTKSIFANDTFKRAYRTFVQAFIAQYLALADANRQTVVVSAVAAGISAVWNAIVQPWLDSRKAARAS